MAFQEGNSEKIQELTSCAAQHHEASYEMRMAFRGFDEVANFSHSITS